MNLKRGGSYIDCRNCLKNENATIPLINDGYKCLKYAATVALNHGNICK